MTTTPAPSTRRFSRPVRRAVNAGHVVFAVGMLGVEWTMMLIAGLARTTDDPTLRHSAYSVLRLLAFAGGIPFGVLSLLTGVLLCVFTPWGLWQHLWIKVKIVLLFAVLISGGAVVSQFVHRLMSASGPGGNADALPALQNWHMAVVAFQLLALIAATALSVFKPSGRRPRPAARVKAAAPVRETVSAR
ncbi:hypothetical protein [Embleya sp. NBC_00896]|uniref:hypothetical protein n=1 Tax=Embleya sp. NBC_00896 TaxID=2975961 RepID=UPI003865D16E|nr:hypothetical protein OG928_18320 [Embleya sp. NBC_00896]